jgi:hypothetical protein
VTSTEFHDDAGEMTLVRRGGYPPIDAYGYQGAYYRLDEVVEIIHGYWPFLSGAVAGGIIGNRADALTTGTIRFLHRRFMSALGRSPGVAGTSPGSLEPITPDPELAVALRDVVALAAEARNRIVPAIPALPIPDSAPAIRLMNGEPGAEAWEVTVTTYRFFVFPGGPDGELPVEVAGFPKDDPSSSTAGD